MALRLGSWGTPELGITERIGDFLGLPRSAQGGSQLAYSPQQLQSEQYYPTNVGLSQSMIATNPTSKAKPQGQVLSASTSSGGGGGGFDMSYYPGWGEAEARADWAATGGAKANQGGGGGGPSPEELARQQAQLELEQALNQYDYYAETATAQKESLGKQKASTLSEMETALGKSEREAGTAKTEAEEATLSAKNKALSTAQDVTKKNRNILRALGILSSSAAGEMLSKPMTEYGTQAAELEQGLIKRKTQVEDWLKDRVAEHQAAVGKLEQQYGELVNNIDRDLRFNEKDKIIAVKSAQAALQQRIQEIQQSQQSYAQAAQQYNANIISQIAQIKLYQNPQADVTSLLSTLLSPQQKAYSGGQASIYQGLTDEQKRLSGLGV